MFLFLFVGTLTTGLYFMIGTRILLPDEYINITDIGGQPNDRFNPGSTLVCVTDNVNMACCRSSDTGYGSIGNWIHNNQSVLSVSAAAWWSSHAFVR